MQFSLKVLAILLCPLSAVFGQRSPQVKPNARVYTNIPKGTISQHTWESTIYPNTIRDYYVYVPAQYDGSTAAALMVFQDGHAYAKADGDFRVPTVFDNLIAQEKMPVTIGLFVDPGHDKDKPVPNSPYRVSNRSNEYDTLSDAYVTFLIKEMIPLLEEEYLISDDPKMRAICGISSGGICAFTAAWQRPDVFHRVLSHIGSFTNIKGGHNYPPLIRSSDPKPIKVFLQDGSNDLDNRFGNWFLANQQMAKALEFKGYDYKFVSDTGAHNGKNAGLILSQSLTWLWDDVLPERLSSDRYRAGDNDSHEMFSGETTHLQDLTCHTRSAAGGTSLNLKSLDHEQIIILRSGTATIKISGEAQNLDEHSVIYLPVGDDPPLQASSDIQYYRIMMKGKSSLRPEERAEAFVLPFDSLSYRATMKGGRRDCFNRSTAMFPYFEMHVTTLKPGMQSHAAHTHRAEELIIMIEGETEEEIGNDVKQGGVGDIYYLGAQVPHSIRNIGTQPCTYFAFQWY